MKIHNQGVRFSLACVLLILGVAWGSPAHAVKPSGGPPGQADGGPPGQAGGALASAIDTTASSTTTTSGTSTATSGVTYSGRAFGAFLNVNLLGLVVGPETLSDTGELPPSGGLLTKQLETVSIPGEKGNKIRRAHV